MNMQLIKGMIPLFTRGGATAVCGLCLLYVFAPAKARADLTIITRMSMSSPVMNNLPAAARADINDMMSESQTYVSGKKYRVTTPILSILVDRDKNQLILIDDSRRIYTISPFDPASASRYAPNGGGMGANIPNAASVDYDVQDTGRSTTLLGHKVRHYVVTVHMNLRVQGEITSREDILAA